MLPVCRWRRLCEVPVKQATASAAAATTATTSSYVIVTIIIIFVVIFVIVGSVPVDEPVALVVLVSLVQFRLFRRED